MKIKITGIEQELKRLKKQLDGDVEAQLSATAEIIAANLAANTPIDTGRARAGWEVTSDEDGHVIIQNDVPYIESLNHGHSKQAPSYFVESILLEYGKPMGTIVISTP